MTGARKFLALGAAAFLLAAARPSAPRAPESPVRDRVAPRPWVDRNTGVDFIHLPGGAFTMGSPPSERGRGEDEIPHRVSLSPFSLSRDEITAEQFEKTTGHDPSHFRSSRGNGPVEGLTWNDVAAFLHLLNDRYPGMNYRLPTEAQWEFACRAGTHSAFSSGGRLTSRQANFDGRFPLGNHAASGFLGRPSPVGSYPANPWGFRDMHGNVWEWCEDWYGPYPPGPAENPRGPRSGSLKVLRGGSWYFDENSCRCALRYTHPPQEQGFSVGFRLVCR